MKRSLLLGMLSLVVVACAHAPQTSPVHVIINASDGAVGRVDTVTLQRFTEAEVRHDSSLVRPLTLTVFFNSLGFVESPETPRDSRDARSRTSALAVRNLSATPWDDGLIVENGEHGVHGERSDVRLPSNLHFRREVALGTYTISDDSGNVLEQRPVVVGVFDPEVAWMSLQLTSMRTTGQYLASRVAAVNK
jgi:hypothetical protein